MAGWHGDGGFCTAFGDCGFESACSIGLSKVRLPQLKRNKLGVVAEASMLLREKDIDVLLGMGIAIDPTANSRCAM